MPRIRQYADKYAMQDLRAHIAGRMKIAGITQQDLGEKLNMSQQTVSRMLSHPENIPLGMLRKICKIVDVDQSIVAKAAWCEQDFIHRT